MFKFFRWVKKTVKSLVSFLFQLIDGITRLFSLIPTAVSALTDAVGYLPSMLVAFATVTITISVVFIIVGRSSGGQK